MNCSPYVRDRETITPPQGRSCLNRVVLTASACDGHADVSRPGLGTHPRRSVEVCDITEQTIFEDSPRLHTLRVYGGALRRQSRKLRIQSWLVGRQSAQLRSQSR